MPLPLVIVAPEFPLIVQSEALLDVEMRVSSSAISYLPPNSKEAFGGVSASLRGA